MTSEVLRRLEAKGLIRCEADPAGTRARRLHVTDQGAELAVRALEAVENADAAFLRPRRPRRPPRSAAPPCPP